MLDIRRHNLESAVVQSLIRDLNAELSESYPEEGATHFRLDREEVAEGRGAFLVARLEGRPVGCGAVRCMSEARSDDDERTTSEAR